MGKQMVTCRNATTWGERTHQSLTQGETYPHLSTFTSQGNDLHQEIGLLTPS